MKDIPATRPFTFILTTLLAMLIWSVPLHAGPSSPGRSIVLAAAQNAQNTDASADSGTSPSATNPPPRELVDALQGALMAAMKEGDKLNYRQRYDRLSPVITRSLDLEFIARLSISKQWKDLSDEQRRRFQDTFKRLSIGTYAANFKEYEGETWQVVSDRKMPRGRVLVRSVLQLPKEKPRTFDYVLRQHKGQWRIINILVDGVSDLALKHAEYGKVMKAEGFDALIAKLDEKIAANERSDQP